MKKLSVFLHMAFAFRKEAWLNIVFNFLSVIFSVFSITMIYPFLGLLFGTMQIVNEKPAADFSSSYFLELLNYYLSNVIKSTNDKSAALLLICVLVVVAFFLKNICRYLAMFYLATIRAGVVGNLRKGLYEKILSLPLSFYTEKRKGDLLSRASVDVQEIEWSIISSLEVLMKDPLNIIFILAGLLIFSPTLTGIVFVVVPVAGIFIGYIGRSLKRTSAKTQGQLGMLISTFEETLSGIRIIKAFSAEDKMMALFLKQNNRHFQLMQRMYRKRDLASPLSEFLGVTSMAFVIFVGGKMVLSKSIMPDQLITFAVLFSQMISPAKAFTNALYNIQRGRASLERIRSVMDEDQRIFEAEQPKEVTAFEKEIRFDHVSFAYGTEEVLKGINLTIPKGSTVALVGQSGAGKSTMADMLPRFYDPQQGDVRIDDIPIRELRLADLRGMMGIVTQESILFNDTVFNNITLGVKSATKEQVEEAARVANAHEFIMQMEQGYDTYIGERGGKLSGGQRQRLSIARAVLKNPPILILDEATSALDTESEKLVQDALFKLMQNRTSLVIAHRLSTIQHADLIVVMQEGNIIEKGKHEELLALNGAYKRLFELQHFA
ncbi:MAG: ABC transporter ATP-binding protein [Flavobacteriales bacterium]|nr:ABC transporter ATP-binding protein [Flavobacteriales bacterium]MCB9449426.1 ABC transporter ATP-binding protein [Flavobacteriales bacterium]